MSVGNQASNGNVDGILSNISVGVRDLMETAVNLSTWVNGGGNGIAYLAQLGYSTAPSSTNPGGVSDAQLASNYISYFNTLAGVYYGTVQQGGNGGTNASTFNFNNALAPLWAGR